MDNFPGSVTRFRLIDYGASRCGAATNRAERGDHCPTPRCCANSAGKGGRSGSEYSRSVRDRTLMPGGALMWQGILPEIFNRSLVTMPHLKQLWQLCLRSPFDGHF